MSILCADKESQVVECIENSEFVVLKISAQWCKPCRELGPVFNSFTSEYPRVKFVLVDVDTLPSYGKAYKLPTTLFYVRGEKEDWVVGNRPDEIRKMLINMK